MSWPKNNQIEEMHKLYMDGYSLSQVGDIYGKTRQSVYGLFVYNGKEIRHKKKPLPYKIFCGRKYVIKNHGYYGATDGNRSLMHRDVWENNNGKIPNGYDIHHKNGDKHDNRLENLECLKKDIHTKLHQNGRV